MSSIQILLVFLFATVAGMDQLAVVGDIPKTLLLADRLSLSGLAGAFGRAHGRYVIRTNLCACERAGWRNPCRHAAGHRFSRTCLCHERGRFITGIPNFRRIRLVNELYHRTVQIFHSTAHLIRPEEITPVHKLVQPQHQRHGWRDGRERLRTV